LSNKWLRIGSARAFQRGNSGGAPDCQAVVRHRELADFDRGQPDE